MLSEGRFLLELICGGMILVCVISLLYSGPPTLAHHDRKQREKEMQEIRNRLWRK